MGASRSWATFNLVSSSALGAAVVAGAARNELVANPGGAGGYSATCPDPLAIVRHLSYEALSYTHPLDP